MVQIFTVDQVLDALNVADANYLGTGSFGETWRVERPSGPVAIKIIHQHGMGYDRLDREIASYRRVSHANVVQLYDAYQVTVAGNTTVALEFEYIAGDDLSKVLAKRRPTPSELRSLAFGLLRGIEAMHAAQLLHRDLKPANIALRDNSFESPVILDLGLAKLLDIESITRYPQLVGTTLYMPPEQLRGERALKASDLFAIGLILFEAATGNHPFFHEGERLTLDEAIERIEAGAEVPSEMAEDVANVITACLDDPAYKRGTVSKALSRLVS